MIRIVLAEDQVLVRDALSKLLGFEPDFEIVAAVGNGQAALDILASQTADIALLDIEMPVLSGLEALDVLHSNNSSCKAIIVTTFPRPGYIQRALDAGAWGYLLKDMDISDLASAIRRIHSGPKVIDSELMMSAWQYRNPLTEREREVLGHAANSRSTKEIAQCLSLSQGTVRNYLSEAISKLEANSRQETVRVAESQGWL